MHYWLHLLRGDEPWACTTLNSIQQGLFGLYVLFTSLIHGIVPLSHLSLSELEKLHSFAVSGSEEQKLVASKILCGASLLRGWNIQV